MKEGGVLREVRRQSSEFPFGHRRMEGVRVQPKRAWSEGSPASGGLPNNAMNLTKATQTDLGLCRLLQCSTYTSGIEA